MTDLLNQPIAGLQTPDRNVEQQDLEFRLGEGTGEAVAMEVIDLLPRILSEIKSFAGSSISDTQE